CVIDVLLEYAVTGVPSSKSQRTRAFKPFARVTLYVAVLPLSMGAGGVGGSVTVSGDGSVIVHTNDSESVFTPSLAATTTLKLPLAVGVPLIKPVVVLMLRPGGRPLAP